MKEKTQRILVFITYALIGVNASALAFVNLIT